MRNQDNPPNPGRTQDFGAAQRIFVRRPRARFKPLDLLPEFAFERLLHELGFGFSSIHRSATDQYWQVSQSRNHCAVANALQRQRA